MLKSLTIKFIILSLILCFPSAFCSAQTTWKLRGSSNYLDFRPVLFLVDQRFAEARNLPSKINVVIEYSSDLEKLISLNMINNVNGISLMTRDSINFVNSFGLLDRFPNLQYLLIQDYPLSKDKKDIKIQLPGSIKMLQQLRQIEFDRTRNLDMPDAIEKLSHLKKLTRLFFTGCKGPLPKQITDFTNIKSISLLNENLEGLDLSKVKWQHVKITAWGTTRHNDEYIIKNLSTVKSLTDLTLEYVNLPDAEVISNFKQLQSLTMYGTKFEQQANLFGNISTLTSLQKLVVSGVVDTTEMLTGIEKLQKLKSLGLYDVSSLTSNPEQMKKIGRLKNLQILELSSGKNALIPEFVKNLTALKSLTISDFNLSKAINGIFLSPSLESLDLSNNNLSALPDLLKYGCKKLKVLELQSNNLVALPTALLGLNRLEVLRIDYNKLKGIPVHGWEQMTSLTNINLSQNQITDFPGGLQLLKKLSIMDLSGNRISTFPELEGEGYQLKSLIITGNNLGQLPSNIGKYNQLEILLANSNALNALPNSLGDCKQLKELKLNYNCIKFLPEGLKDTKYLELLDVSENVSINPASVFNVLLSIPRKHLIANLSKIGLQTIPDSESWKAVSFAKLNLNGNKLTTLPARFAMMKDYQDLTLSNNPLGIDPFICNRPIKNKSDMKILYDELGIHIENNLVPDTEYAGALAERVTDYYWNKKYDIAISYANKALSIDSNGYRNKVKWDEIGISRFHAGDYRGAIEDFNQFMIKEAKVNIHWGPSLTQVEQYKSDAHQALGEKDKAAETHIYFAKQHRSINGYAQAFILYKELENHKRAGEVKDTLLLSYQEQTLANVKYKNSFNPTFIVEYAEVLLIADQPGKAIELLNRYEDKLFPGNYLAIKDYLLSTAMYMNGERTYEQAKSNLINRKKVNGKITGWSFDMFNNWMRVTIKSEPIKSQLLSLQKAAVM